MVQRKGIFSNFIIDEADADTVLWLGEPSGDFHQILGKDTPIFYK